MKVLAIIAIVLICLLVIAAQHLFNKWIREDLKSNPLAIFGVLGIIVSMAILGVTIYNAVLIFGCQ